MSQFDAQEFGRLQAQVEQLIRSNEANTAALIVMSNAIQAMQLQMAEAKGGWRALMMIGGASASAGGLISWAVTHIFGKGPP